MAAKTPHPPSPESHNQHHHRALSQQPNDDMVALLIVVGWKLLVSSCLELTPIRGTHGDELWMNQRMTRPTRGLFTEGRRRGVLRTTSPVGRSRKFAQLRSYTGRYSYV